MELKPQKPGKLRIPWVWLILLLVTIVWNAVLFLRTGEPQADIPYSAFLDHVHGDNIASVDIQGDQITGEFVNPIAWPQPMHGSTPASASALTATTPVTYMAFLTTFPEALRLIEYFESELTEQPLHPRVPGGHARDSRLNVERALSKLIKSK